MKHNNCYLSNLSWSDHKYRQNRNNAKGATGAMRCLRAPIDEWIQINRSKLLRFYKYAVNTASLMNSIQASFSHSIGQSIVKISRKNINGASTPNIDLGERRKIVESHFSCWRHWNDLFFSTAQAVPYSSKWRPFRVKKKKKNDDPL